jgi:4-hydroxy-tetrahydrodipicolinate synthase
VTVQLSDALRGVGVTPVTPFTEDLTQIDRSGLADNLAYLVDQGVRLLYVGGNTGEALSLSLDEWTLLVETSLEVAGGALVVPGIGHEYSVALEMARRAGASGVAGILALPRQQPYVASQGLCAYWRSIIDEAGLPAVVYKRGFPADQDLTTMLDHPLVVGCKYAERDISQFRRTVASDDSGVLWTCGIAERYAPFFHLAGAVGFTSGLANFAPRLALGLQAMLEKGDMDGAFSFREECLEFEEIRALHGDAYNVAAVKAAMDALGLRGGGVRPPLIEVDEQTRVRVGQVAARMTQERSN